MEIQQIQPKTLLHLIVKKMHQKKIISAIKKVSTPEIVSLNTDLWPGVMKANLAVLTIWDGWHEPIV